MSEPGRETTENAPARAISRRRLLALAGGAVIVGACSDSAAKAPATSASTLPSTTTTLPRTTTSTSTTTTTTLAPASAETIAAGSSTTAAPTTTAVPAPVEPLTGLPLQDPALLQRVALVVKVSNDPGARPQTGLNDPDIIFEAWGAGPTRFATVWHSRDLDFVGPIRSCREQDVNLLGEFNRAVFACSGGNPGNIKLLRDSDMLLVTEGRGPGWELDPKRGRPHKTHANTALLRSNAGPDRTGPAQQYHYRAVGEAATAGDPMTGFDLQIQSVFVQWRWDDKSGTYLRSQANKPHKLTDGKQVSTENVVVLWMDYDPSHTDGRSPDGNSVGTNALLVFTGGRMVTGTWSRADRLQPFALNDASGAPILLTPGRTFFELPNNGNGVFKGEVDVLTQVP